MALITLKASPVGSALFEVSDSGAVSAVGLASTGAITGTSAVLSGALSSATLTTTGLNTQAAQTIAMGAANKTLILTGTPTTNQVLLAASVLAVSATGATRTLTLPAASSMTGKQLTIYNAGGESVIVADSDGTIVTIAASKGASLCSNGSGYGSLLGA
jgi:Flp pilus assembly secretin CpaC